jgi:hypothetical protein
MTEIEYREALAALDLTQRAAADFLKVDERTSRRWAAGDREMIERRRGGEYASPARHAGPART